MCGDRCKTADRVQLFFVGIVIMCLPGTVMAATIPCSINIQFSGDIFGDGYYEPISMEFNGSGFLVMNDDTIGIHCSGADPGGEYLWFIESEQIRDEDLVYGPWQGAMIPYMGMKGYMSGNLGDGRIEGNISLKERSIANDQPFGMDAEGNYLILFDPPGLADFTTSPDIPLVGNLVRFDASSSQYPPEHITHYHWLFDDDTQADGIIVSHAFAEYGDRNVTLLLTTDDDQQISVSKCVYVYPPYYSGHVVLVLNAQFEIPGESGLDNLPILASGFVHNNGDSIFFDYSNVEDYGFFNALSISGSLEIQRTHLDGWMIGQVFYDKTYTWRGPVEGTLYKNTFYGEFPFSKYVQGCYIYGRAFYMSMDNTPSMNPPSEYQPPTPQFTFSPLDPEVDEVITFDASISTDPDGTITGYYWEFGEGNESAGQVTEFAYERPGTYDVTLMVTDDTGFLRSVNHTVTVAPVGLPPVADFTIEDINSYQPSGIEHLGENLLGKKAVLDASPSYDPDGYITRYSWSVDGRYLEENPGWISSGWDFGAEHIVASAWFPRNDYEVTLEVEDDKGNVARVTKTISVDLQPSIVRMSSFLQEHRYVDTCPSVLDPFGSKRSSIWELLCIPSWYSLEQVGTMYYLHNGEYAHLALSSEWARAWKSADIVYFIQRPENPYTIEDIIHIEDQAPGYEILGYLEINPISHRVMVAEGIGIYLADIYHQWLGLDNADSTLIQSLISLDQVLSYDYPVPPTTTFFTVHLQWPGSDLDLALETPGGTTLNNTTWYQHSRASYYREGENVVLRIEQPEPGTWTIKVTGIDVPPEGEAFNLSIIRSEIPAFVIPLHTGWNFISLPSYPPEGNHTAAVFSQVESGKPCYVYEAPAWRALETTDVLEPLVGYWIYSEDETEVSFTGRYANPPIPPFRVLSPGWNAIGTGSLSPISTDEALHSLEDSWVTLLRFDNSLQVYTTPVMNGFGNTPMMPGQGYWIYMNEEGELVGFG